MKLPIELKRKYLHRRLEDMRIVRLTVDQGDFSQALRVGHQVKGNAQTFEVPQIAWLGTELETAAKKQDVQTLRRIVQRMEVIIQGIVCES